MESEKSKEIKDVQDFRWDLDKLHTESQYIQSLYNINEGLEKYNKYENDKKKYSSHAQYKYIERQLGEIKKNLDKRFK